MKPKSVRSVIKRQSTAVGRELQVPWLGLHSRVREDKTRRLIHGLLGVSFYCSVLAKREISNTAKLSVF